MDKFTILCIFTVLACLVHLPKVAAESEDGSTTASPIDTTEDAGTTAKPTAKPPTQSTAKPPTKPTKPVPEVTTVKPEEPSTGDPVPPSTAKPDAPTTAPCPVCEKCNSTSVAWGLSLTIVALLAVILYLLYKLRQSKPKYYHTY